VQMLWVPNHPLPAMDTAMRTHPCRGA
jgi:hypothetical protein